MHQQKVACNPTCGSVLIVLIAPCHQDFLLPYTQKALLEIAHLDHLYIFPFVHGIYRVLKFVSSSDSVGLSCINQFHYIVRTSPSYSGWYQWPLDHTSVQTRCRPNVMEGTIPVFIMLDNIVEIAAEGEGRTTKLHEHWLSTHPTCSMGKWASCLWAVEILSHSNTAWCTLHVWTTDTIPNRMRQSSLAIESSWYYLAGQQFLIAFRKPVLHWWGEDMAQVVSAVCVSL